MLKRLLVFLAILAGLAALADRGLAVVAGNATAKSVKLHEGLREDPEVRFRGFPFLTQAVKGKFQKVDVTVRDLEREGLTIDRIDATLEGVEVDMGEALNGRVTAVPVQEGEATVRVTFGDLTSYLATKPGNLRVVLRDGRPAVTSTFGIPGAGSVEVAGTPAVKVQGENVRVTVSNVRAAVGAKGLTATLAASAAVRMSFTIPLDKLPFGIDLESAELTDTALVVKASADGIVVDVRDAA
jgi:hypothetical protein